MENSSEIAFFVLGAYTNMGQLKYLYFILLLLWYFSICVANTVLIVVIFVERRLHEPMYMLLCNLLVNEISGSTSLYPLMLSQMFPDVHEVPVSWCFLQMCYIYMSASVEFCSLAAMAYDRYVSICNPLHYSVTMNTGRVAVIIPLVWLYSFALLLLHLLFVVNLKFCGNVINKVFCDPQLLASLACSVSVVSSITELLYTILAFAIPFALIMVSYIQILVVCFNTSKENKQKAISTCTPQIVSVSNLFVGCTLTVFETKIEGSRLPDKVRVFFSVYLLVCQPIITPFMYGLNLPKIRHACKKILWRKKVFFLQESF
ncbi:olfactory receptor 10A6-like [Dunckerocampus dactyliophorus]|uniref:olfactory receptor 10A6-like n=1 Tax=Dunckerocampus dactyliophorus TaxID=161453 RepID=UPI002406BE85|nr:olfactory receptor 10A6-like [Dunckerocampus dactyliophorus]